METVIQALESLNLAPSSSFLNLTIFPLLSECDPGRNYTPLRDAVRSGSATVREVSHGGSVPELSVENAGKEPVLILEGEELVGAKQNRTANITILVAPGTRLRIPVTCVESGRWGYTSRDFRPSDQIHFARGRLNKMASVSQSMKCGGSRSADQSAVWDDIASKANRMRVSTPTGAMNDVFEAHRARLEDYVRAFHAVPQQLGAIFAINGRVEGLEVFDCNQTFSEMLPMLVRSYAIDAIEKLRTHRQNPKPEDATRFLDLLCRAEIETYPAVGEGSEARLTAPDGIGAGLVAEGRLIHLVAFAERSRRGSENRNFDGLRRLLSRRGSLRRGGEPC